MAEGPKLPAWDETLKGNIAGDVPDLIQETNALVEQYLAQNKTWATDALDAANTAIEQLSQYQVPHISDPPRDPLNLVAEASFPVGPPSPELAPSLGTITPVSMPPFNPEDIIIPDINADMPVYIPVITGLGIPDAPIFVIPETPTEPGLDLSFETGEAPEPQYGPMPALIPYTLPVYTPIVLPPFDIGEPPEFTMPPPNTTIPWVEPVYDSDIKDAIEGVILEMLQGGTGLTPQVEQALYARAYEREDENTQKIVSETTDQWASRGFAHPPGQLNGQTIAVREAAHRKANELSREIMVNQAELEQKNRQFAVTSGISYEQIFSAMFMQIVDRNFQIAKFTVETAIQVFNMYIQIFNTQQLVFAQRILYYKALLEAAMVPLEVYKVLVEAEQAKAQTNMAIVGAYKAQVEAYTAEVEAYKTRVEAEVAKSAQQKMLVDIYKAQIDAMVAQIAGQKGMFDAYTARVGGEVAKASLEEANAKVYVAQVQGWSSKNELYFKRAEVQIAENKLDLDYLIADVQRATSFVSQQLALIHANLAQYQASIGLETARHSAEIAEAQLDLQKVVEEGKLELGYYSASLEKWKADAQVVIQTAQIQAESIKAAGQLSSNLAAGAMAGTHVSAGISGGASSSQQRSDQKQESKSFNQQISSSYQEYHPYKPI